MRCLSVTTLCIQVQTMTTTCSLQIQYPRTTQTKSHSLKTLQHLSSNLLLALRRLPHNVPLYHHAGLCLPAELPNLKSQTPISSAVDPHLGPTHKHRHATPIFSPNPTMTYQTNPSTTMSTSTNQTRATMTTQIPNSSLKSNSLKTSPVASIAPLISTVAIAAICQTAPTLKVKFSTHHSSRVRTSSSRTRVKVRHQMTLRMSHHCWRNWASNQRRL